MSLLKSAWEIALERTEEIKADPEKIRNEALLNDGRRLAGSYLFADDPEEIPIEETYAACEPDKKEMMREGIAITILLNIALPQTEDYMARFDRIHHLAELIGKESPEATKMLGQIKMFFQKYTSAKEGLIERVKQQYQGIFEEKQERLMQKYGKGINVSMEQDPEYIQMIQKGYAQISAQYQQVLSEAKEQLKQMWGIERL